MLSLSILYYNKPQRFSVWPPSCYLDGEKLWEICCSFPTAGPTLDEDTHTNIRVLSSEIEVLLIFLTCWLISPSEHRGRWEVLDGRDTNLLEEKETHCQSVHRRTHTVKQSAAVPGGHWIYNVGVYVSHKRKLVTRKSSVMHWDTWLIRARLAHTVSLRCRADRKSSQ